MNNKSEKNSSPTKQINRRKFLCSTAAAGAGLMISPAVLDSAEAGQKTDDINIALLGAGNQGRRLLDACLHIDKNSGVRFRAVCDIWEKYSLRRSVRILQHYKHDVNAYVDYQDMLASEKDLDAVLIATPDFCHAEQTIACLKGGLHVYCETPMSRTLEDARRMVQTARQTKKLLQIGQQLRSNPIYLHCYNKLLNEARLLGRIIGVNGQRNVINRDRGWPRKAVIDPLILKRYKFDSMKHFMNWRWYKELSSGPVAHVGSLQIDVFNWFLGMRPSSVMAGGIIECRSGRIRNHNIHIAFEYETIEGTVVANYQTHSNSVCGSYYETFMGDEATLATSERRNLNDVLYLSSSKRQSWEKWIEKGYLVPDDRTVLPEMPFSRDAVMVLMPCSECLFPGLFYLPVKPDFLIHQPHLENFFDAIRGRTELNCPAEIGYETAVSVFKVNDAVEAERKLFFQPDEFEV